jgi:hypothetical protein
MSEKEMLKNIAERAEQLPEAERALLLGYARGLKDAQTMQADNSRTE